MGSYEVLWKSSAERDLRKLDPQHIPQILKAVEALADNPFPLRQRILARNQGEQARLAMHPLLLMYILLAIIVSIIVLPTLIGDYLDRRRERHEK